MDEQRVQAYVALIEKLFACPGGEEGAVLQQHGDLVDGGLVQVMEALVAQLRQQGRGQQADWLENLTGQIGQAMGMGGAVSPSGGELPGDLNGILQELSQPVRDVRQMGRRVELCRRALALVPRQGNEPLWAALQMELGNSSYQNSVGDRSQNIKDAIHAYSQSLKVRNREIDPIGWAKSTMGLANAYSARLEGNREQDIETAICLYKQCLEVITYNSEPLDWARIKINLASTYLDRTRGDYAQNIEISICLYKECSHIIKNNSSPIEWAGLMAGMAAAYSERIYGNRAHNIEASIKHCKESLKVRRLELMPLEWALSTLILAKAYSDRTYGDQAENIEISINLLKKISGIFTKDLSPAIWATAMTYLADSYQDRIYGTRSQNIEASISVYKKALTVLRYDATPIDWARCCMHLGNAYKNRIRGDRSQNIEQSIAYYQYSLEVFRKESMPLKWSELMANIGNAYYLRILGNVSDNIDRSISFYEQALQATDRESYPNHWSAFMTLLANAYKDRVTGIKEENIEKSINLYQESLKHREQGKFPRQWAESMNNLALANYLRVQGSRSDNIEKSIRLYEKCLQVRSLESFPFERAQTLMNLAMSYSNRMQGDHARNTEIAIVTYSQALNIFTPDAHPNDCRRTARLLANLYADHDRWSEAKATYCTALDAAEILYQAAISKGSQEAELKETNDLYRRAAYAYAKVGDLETAIATIEQGRARSLSETLQRDRADLEAIRQINPELAERYQTAANAIRLLESTERRTGLLTSTPLSEPEDFRNQATQARQALQDCLTEIRQIPGYESFLALPTFADITATLQPDQPLIYLIPIPNGSLALTVHLPSRAGLGGEGQPPVPRAEAIWLDDFTETNLLTLLANDTKTGWFDAYQNQTQDRDAWFATLDRTLHKLWQPLLAPLLHHLSQAKSPTATLIPTGLFSLLPLHAAWTRDTQGNRRYACDFIQFTYAPNALALPAAREVAAQPPATTLLAINDPQPVSASSLPSASIETANAIATFPGSNNRQLLQHEAATPAAVLAALPSYPVAHFSCHGKANFRSPLDSGLAMAHDETLTLRDLLDLKLKGLRLAVLSACETGIPGTDLPDEVISLPTGLLQAGAAGVVSSLWSVADLSTMVLLSRFYQLWRTDGLEPPAALRQAQLWLRDSTGPELAPYLPASHPELAAQLQQAANQRPFAHPFHWAAFTYVGV
jgi:CHAT domain-containing protein/tetratricopeptide (TPR) repeat protein